MNKLTKLTKQPAILLLVVWFSLGWSWTLQTDSLDLAGSKSQGLILAVIISAINVAISVAVMWNMIKVVRWVFARYSNIWLSMAIALPVFALADFLVSWLNTILWLGPQGRIDNILPLSSPTLIFINTPLSFAARLVGFYGLAAFIWLTLFLLWSKKTRKYALVPILVLSLLSLIGWAVYRTPSGTTFTAKIISESLDKRVPAINPTNTDLTVFPEYGLDEVTNETLSSRIEMNSISDPTKHYFLGSEQVNPEDRTGHLNRLIFGNTVDGFTYKQDKYRLIPGGEDLPFSLRFALRATNQKSTLDYFSYAKGTLKGPHPLVPFKINDTTLVGAAVCSSIIAPQDYRRFAQEGATAFTNSASLTIFKGSSVFSFQQKSLARFMAVANARYFLQSANSARAYALDINGNTVTEATGHQVLDVNVQNNTKKTMYTYAGEWLTYLGVIIGLALLVIHRRDKGAKTRHKKTLQK